MEALLPLAEKIGARLKQRNETIGIAESSTGGLISAALLSIGGASAYFRGGGVIYTAYARQAFLKIPNPLPAPIGGGDRDDDRILVYVHADESCRLFHGPSPVPEAPRQTIRRDPRSCTWRDGSPLQGGHRVVG
jgi:hypothetical protein